MNNLLWWGLLFASCIVIEASSPGHFFFASFACGSLGGFIAAWVGMSLSLQLLTFLVTAGVVLFLLKKYARWLLRKDTVKTNVYALKGKKGVVLVQIEPFSRGWIKVESQTWSAASLHAETIEKEAIVEVVSTAGSHVIVKKIKQSH